MKAYQIHQSLSILNQLMQIKLPMKKAYQIYLLTKDIYGHREFFMMKEQELLSKYGGQVDSETNHIYFQDNNAKMAFEKEHNELMNIQVELQVSPITLTESDVADFRISPVDIAGLDGLITFE